MSADPFATLSDPSRRRIVDALRGGERSVGEIVRVVDIEQSGVSRHLHILLDAGFVTVRKDGQRRLYALRREPFDALDAWLSAHRAVWEERLDAFGAALAKRSEARAKRSEMRVSPRPARGNPSTKKTKRTQKTKKTQRRS